MRLLEREMPLDPEVERELEAIDRALAGEPVDPDLEDLARLALELRAERPEPDAEADARLDVLAAAGFPPRTSDRARAPAPTGLGRLRRPAREQGRAAPASRAGRGERVRGRNRDRRLAERGSEGRREPARQTASQGRPDGTATVDRRTPLTTQAAGRPTPTVRTRGRRTDLPTSRSSRRNRPAALGSLSAGPNDRKVAQNVDLALSTSPDDFRDAADGVLDVVRDHRGFVVRSNVSGGDPRVRGSKRGRASFTLRIPAGELSAAMGDLSDLGHVVSRSDGSVDITNRFVSARKRIDALTASRDQLLQELGQAVTITEQQSIRARLRIVQAQLAGAHQTWPRRSSASTWSRSASRSPPTRRPATGGAWTIGDAFHDAGRVLTVTAGAALVGGAALLPFALLGALAAAGRREWVRRQRNRALDAAPGPSPS